MTDPAMRSPLAIVAVGVLAGCVLDDPGTPDARVYPTYDASRSTGFRDAGCGGGGPSGGGGSGTIRSGSGTSGLDCGDAAPVDVVPDAAPSCSLVEFRYVNEAATSVWVSGTFTAPPWSPTPPGALPMAQDGLGAWTLSIEVSPGRHLYKLIVDGDQWIPDPGAPTEDDGMGNVNSVLEVCGVP